MIRIAAIVTALAFPAVALPNSRQLATQEAVWSEMGDMPTALSDMTASVVGSSVYVIGGCIDHQASCDWYEGCTYCPSITAQVLIFATTSNTWSIGANDAPRARYRHAAAVYDGKVYLLGGRDLDDGLIGHVDVLDATDNTWVTLAAKWGDPKSDLSAFVYGDVIHAIGGYDLNYVSSVATTDTLAPSDTDNPKGNWTLASDSTSSTIAEMSAGRGDFAVVENSDGDGLFYVFGGWSSSDWCSPLKSTEVYDPVADSWTTLASELLVGRGDKACGALSGRLYAIGGEHNNGCASGNTPVNDVEVYDPDDATLGWVRHSTIPEHKFRFASATVGQVIYVFGGQTNLTEGTEGCGGTDDGATCYPVTDHTWAFTDDDVEDSVSRGASRAASSLASSLAGWLALGGAAAVLAL